VKFNKKLIEARFIERLNRFAAVIDCEDEKVLVHIANSGRLRELFTPDNTMYLTPADPTSNRKTAYDLTLVGIGDILVSADARAPNTLLAEAIECGFIKEFSGYTTIKREVTTHDSRLDIRLSGPKGDCYIEAKSVTLVENGIALFPDAPTTKGAKHIRTLATLVNQGHRAAAVFVVQRPDASALRPDARSDPEFHKALTQAVSSGVEVYAYNCRVSLSEMWINDAIPVLLD
jgi:sugar fermentation stimulation protein A